MTVPYRLLLLGAAGLALLAGCDRNAEKAAPAAPVAPGPAAQVTPADAAAPMAYESKTPFANVKLTLPIAIKGQPDLHARLYSTGVRELRQFTEGAQADRTEFGGDGDLPTYEKSIEWSLAADTGKLFSLRRQTYDYSGGAHPNGAFGAILWDKALQRAVEPGQLFRAGADLTPLDRALCDAVNLARKARDPAAERLTLGGEGVWNCPRAAQTPFVLAPSTTPGKAGGLIFLIGPYQVGPYAEGGYEIAVPQTLFRPLIAAAYADEFVGQPVKSGDVTPR